MSIFKKSISLILSLILALGVVMPAQAKEDNSMKSPADYIETLWNEGYEPVSAQTIVDVLDHFSRIISILTGRENESKSFNVTLDKFTTDLLNYIYENSGFDLGLILTNLPDINIPANIATETFNIDTTEIRDAMYAKRAECDAKGDSTMATLYHFLGAYFSIIENCEVFGEETEEENVYELGIRVTYKDKTQEVVKPGLYINTVTGECSNKDDSGMLGIGFNFSLSDMVLYATVNCWMRDFGFCLLYDVLANSMPVVYRYNTRRFKFEYDGLQWMVQAWKGNYFVANGGEVGLYCRTPKSYGSFYECASDEQMLNMSMKVLHDDKVLVEKPLQKHWWINGFNLSGQMYLPQSITMEFTIEMPDEGMRKAFCESIENHYQKDVSYTVDGDTVCVVW